MLRNPPINLNRQSQNATILLIREVQERGIQLSHVRSQFQNCSRNPNSPAQVYVDALGDTGKYQDFLSAQFPGIGFTVTTKADSKFKIVGAASVAAKVTRDACLDEWVFEEQQTGLDTSAIGSGYPSGPSSIPLHIIFMPNNQYLQIRRHSRGSRVQSSPCLDFPALHASHGQPLKCYSQKMPTKSSGT
jgi:ribonuclease HII